MRKIFSIVSSVTVWVALVAYIAWAARQCSVRERDLPASGVEVVVKDSAELQVITPGMVKLWIIQEGLIPPNTAAREVPLGKIEKLVRSRGFVRAASVYGGLDGKVHIELEQRRPVIRFNTSTGYNFYLTADRWVLPAQAHAAIWLPIVTGNYTPPFERGYAGPLDKVSGAGEKKLGENYIFLYKLINFVEFISNSDFWSAQVEQINLVDRSGSGQGFGVYEPQVELIPRAGNHVVMLGSVDDYESKLAKLLVFYDKALAYEGWDAYKYIDLSYRNQIVCTK